VKTIGVKLLRVAAMVAGVLLFVRLVVPRLGERMERMFDEAPEDFPPKWMYVNITAIRENTERLLEALVPEGAETDAAVV